jgi:hypothetical protein
MAPEKFVTLLVNFLDIGFLVRYGISMNLRANERRSTYSQVSLCSLNDHTSLSGVKLITIVLVLTVGEKVKVRIATQYSGSKTLLKEARQFESAAVLTVTAAQPVEAPVL